MKREFKSAFVAAVATATAAVAISCQQSPQEIVISGDFKFCESTTPYNGGVLIPSFGVEEFDPRNSQGKGYVSYYKDGVTKTIIEADGTLNAPKGTAVYKDQIIICDVAKAVIYNLKDASIAPIEIPFPEGEFFVNDVVVMGDEAYLSVTNTGNIFKLDLKNPTPSGLSFAMHVPGANGLLLEGRTLYVASYPVSGVISDENVIYIIDDIENPVLRRLNEKAARYDGLAKMKGSNYIYASNWAPVEILKIDIRTGESEPLSIAEQIEGPADISILDGYLCIPDLMKSSVVMYKLSE